MRGIWVIKEDSLLLAAYQTSSDILLASQLRVQECDLSKMTARPELAQPTLCIQYWLPAGLLANLTKRQTS